MSNATQKPDDTTTGEAALLARHIGRLFANAMQAAENAIDAMTYVARQIETHEKHNPDAMRKAMDAVGITALDRRCLAMLLEIQDWPQFSKLTSGLLPIGTMASTRKETK